MTRMQAVRDWLGACPALEGRAPGQDYLAEGAVSIAVDAVPAASAVRRYRDGSAVRQLGFALAVRAEYGPDGVGQRAAETSLEGAADWLRAGALPALPEGCTPLRAQITASGYVAGTELDTARYEMQCRLTYFQKGV